MKKCKWCHSNIEDYVTVCPYCKAGQSDENSSKQTNHVESFLEKQTNVKTNTQKATNFPKYKITTPTKYSKNTKDDDIHQIATDLRFIKNVIIAILVLYLVGAIYIALNIL